MAATNQTPSNEFAIGVVANKIISCRVYDDYRQVVCGLVENAGNWYFLGYEKPGPVASALGSSINYVTPFFKILNPLPPI